MSKLLVLCGLLYLLITPASAGPAQDYTPRLDSTLEKLKNYFADKKPEWKHRSIEPIEGSRNVSVNNWESERQFVRISIVALGSEAEAIESMRRFGFQERTLDRLPELGDGGYSWGMGGSNICFRKSELTIWVSTSVTNLKDAIKLSQEVARLTNDALADR